MTKQALTPGREGGRERVLIVGAGPAGLATAACLRRLDVPSTVLERSHEVGAAWHSHYDRLHLHTTKKVSALPYFPFPRDFPKYPSRLQMIDYLERYAREFDIRPLFGQEVRRIRTRDGAWEVTTHDSTYHAWNVVIATGINDLPHVPEWPGQGVYAGRLMHSAQYRSGEPFRGKRVLVVGFGNSGGEIALDLWEHGARPTMSLRGPGNVVPRDILGVPITSLGGLAGLLPERISDALNSQLIRLAVGDLAPYGVQPPPNGPFAQIRTTGRIPLIDVGTVRLIKRREVLIRPGIESFHETGVRFSDGREEPFDAVILATGFRPAWSRFLEADGPIEGGAAATPELERRNEGLFFCGFSTIPSGMLRQIGIHSRRIADAIAARSR